MDAQKVIDEARPMLEAFLSDIGIHSAGRPLDFPRLLDPFSHWIGVQEVSQDDRVYLAVRVAAFICEYLIEVRSGQRSIQNGRIVMRVPVQEGVLREFDPYAVALGMAANRDSLKGFLDAFCS